MPHTRWATARYLLGLPGSAPGGAASIFTSLGGMEAHAGPAAAGSVAQAAPVDDTAGDGREPDANRTRRHQRIRGEPALLSAAPGRWTAPTGTSMLVRGGDGQHQVESRATARPATGTRRATGPGVTPGLASAWRPVCIHRPGYTERVTVSPASSAGRWAAPDPELPGPRSPIERAGAHPPTDGSLDRRRPSGRATKERLALQPQGAPPRSPAAGTSGTVIDHMVCP